MSYAEHTELLWSQEIPSGVQAKGGPIHRQWTSWGEPATASVLGKGSPQQALTISPFYPKGTSLLIGLFLSVGERMETKK